MLCASVAMLALLPLPGGSPWLDGWSRDHAGELIDYGSALPEVGSALLVRSIDAARFIEWETAAVPEAWDGDRASFVWLFGLDVDDRPREFELSVDGEALLRFRNPTVASFDAWSVEGAGGARLELRPTRIDRHDDLFGFAVLTLPRERLRPGAPLRLRLTGESAGSSVWAMTFRAAPRAGMRLLARDALRRTPAGLEQPLVLEVVHLGDPVTAALETGWGAPREVALRLGANRFELSHPEVDAPRAAEVALRLPGAAPVRATAQVGAVRRWTVHLVQHTHTDLGYTRPQTEILPDHLRYLDYALDYCDLTDDYPDDARFRWTCEASWPVREWLRYRPAEQVARLRCRVAEGRIELTALFANSSELLDERGCAASLEPVAWMRRAGLPVVAAMQDDVNGVAWSFADLLPELGVRYLVMGEHGHRARIPFDVPTAFWWESPSGSRLLAWRPDHYNTGNFWGIHSGRLETVEPELFAYLGGLRERGYPHDRVAVQYSGVFLDNAPPGLAANDFIRDWNERYAWPRLRAATVSELPRTLEAEAGEELAVWRAAWPDWWSDGVGSAPREAAAARKAQDELTAVEALLAMAALEGLAVPEDLAPRVSRAREQLVLYAEHTYGAAESVRDPGAENSQVQWAEKAAFVWHAVKEVALLRELAFGLVQGRMPRSDAPTVTVVNPGAWPRSGLVRFFVDEALLPESRAFRLVDETGAPVPVQRWKAQHDGDWWAAHVEEVPAMGWRSYRLEALDAAPAAAAPEGGVLRNAWYQVEVDPARGGLVSWAERATGRELVDPDAPWGFGQLVHERLGNRWQLERFLLDDFEREALPASRVEAGDAGPLWRSLVLHGPSSIGEAGDALRTEVRLYEREKKLELRYRLRKRPSTAPEGLYAALPFAIDRSRLVYEAAGGAVDPERDQLPRTSSDWSAAQRFVGLRGDGVRVHLSSTEVLLHHLGGLNLGRFADRAVAEGAQLFPWLLNNYWVTNFLADESGELVWTLALSSEDDGGDAAQAAWSATRFGWDHQLPLLARVLPPTPQGAPLPPPRSWFRLEGAKVVLVGARAAGGKLHLQLREAAGEDGVLSVRGADGEAWRLQPADALGDPVGPEAATFAVRARAAFHLLVELP